MAGSAGAQRSGARQDRARQGKAGLGCVGMCWDLLAAAAALSGLVPGSVSVRCCRTRGLQLITL